MTTQKKRSEFEKFLIFGGIWLSSGFINMLLFSKLTDINAAIPSIIHFILPAIALFATIRFIQIGFLFKFFSRLLFNRKKAITESEVTSKFKLATPISMVTFIAIGLITCFWSDTYLNTLAIYGIVGGIWGYIWYLALSKEYVDLDNFD